MATQFFSGTFPSADPGVLISVLDSCFSGHANWSVYDSAAGTNCKVYRCYVASSEIDFYLYVDNNYSGYAVIEMWDGWDSVTHTGIGYRLYYMGATTTYLLRIWVYNGVEWRLTLTDRNFHFGHNHSHYFFGGLDEMFGNNYCTWPILLALRGTSTGLYNPVGYGSASTANCDCLFFLNHEGRFRCGGWLNSQSAGVQINDIVGFQDKTIVYDYESKKAVGKIHNCVSFGNQSSSERILQDGDTVVVSGETWLCFKQSVSDYPTSLMRIS